MTAPRERDGLTWFKCYSEICRDLKLGLLSHADRWAYVCVLCLKSEGLLDTPVGTEMLREVLRLDEEAFLALRARLERVLLIEPDWQPISWEKRQQPADKTSAERQQRHRERQAALRNRDVTPSPTVTVTGREAEAEYRVQSNTSPGGDVRAPARARRPRKNTGNGVVPYADIADLFNGLLGEYIPTITTIEGRRAKRVSDLWYEPNQALALGSIDQWGAFCRHVRESEFLTGRSPPRAGSDKPFRASFDWLLKPENYVKVCEGNFHG